jgi:hypothetical protein
MTTSNLDRILEPAKALTPDEQRSLRDLVVQLLVTTAPRVTGEEFEQHLLEKGIVSRIPPRIRDARFYSNRRAVRVERKPVSEIIIEERR